MKLKFWGVRGSIPSPGPATVRYGGNTTCIEIRTDDNQLIILDGGSGIFPLSRALVDEMPLTAHIFSTHSHWDHIQGLPFFLPIYAPGNLIRLYGAFDEDLNQGPERIMTVQLQNSYFPVAEGELKSGFDYVLISPGEAVRFGDATVTPVVLNHPVINLGYRIDCHGKSIFFTGDYEPELNTLPVSDPDHASCQREIDQRYQEIVDAIQGVDVLVADASYTRAEYATHKKGWGHGTYDSCIQLARDAGASILYCTHHEPTRSDDELERVFSQALEEHKSRLERLEVRLAREGDEWLL